jgi:plasmid stability protein
MMKLDGVKGATRPKYKSGRNKMTQPVRQRSAKRKEIIDECLVDERVYRGNSYGHRGGRDRTLIDKSADTYAGIRSKGGWVAHLRKCLENNKKLKRKLRIRAARRGGGA